MISNKENKRAKKIKMKQINNEIWLSLTFLSQYAEYYKKKCFHLLVFQWVMCFIFIFFILIDFLVLFLFVGAENADWVLWALTFFIPLISIGGSNAAFYAISRTFTFITFSKNNKRCLFMAYYFGCFTLNILPLIHCFNLYKSLKQFASGQQENTSLASFVELWSFSIWQSSNPYFSIMLCNINW